MVGGILRRWRGRDGGGYCAEVLWGRCGMAEDIVRNGGGEVRRGREGVRNGGGGLGTRWRGGAEWWRILCGGAEGRCGMAERVCGGAIGEWEQGGEAVQNGGEAVGSVEERCGSAEGEWEKVKERCGMAEGEWEKGRGAVRNGGGGMRDDGRALRTRRRSKFKGVFGQTFEDLFVAQKPSDFPAN